MTAIRVNPDALATEGRELERIAAQIRELEHRIANSYGRVGWEARRRTPIDAIVGQVRQRARQLSTESDRLGRGLGQLGQAFRHADQVSGSKIAASMGPLSQKSQAFTTGPGMALAFPREELSAQLRPGVPGANPTSVIGAIPAVGAGVTGVAGVAGAVTGLGNGVVGLANGVGTTAGNIAATYGPRTTGMATGAGIAVTGALARFGAWTTRNAGDLVGKGLTEAGTEAVEFAVKGRSHIANPALKGLAINMQGANAKPWYLFGASEKAAWKAAPKGLMVVDIAADVVVEGTEAYHTNRANPRYDGSDFAAATALDTGFYLVPTAVGALVSVKAGPWAGYAAWLGTKYVWDEWAKPWWQTSEVRRQAVGGLSRAIDDGTVARAVMTGTVATLPFEVAAKTEAGQQAIAVGKQAVADGAQAVVETGKQAVEGVRKAADDIGKGLSSVADRVVKGWGW